jgi:hypothetical protein
MRSSFSRIPVLRLLVVATILSIAAAEAVQWTSNESMIICLGTMALAVPFLGLLFFLVLILDPGRLTRRGDACDAGVASRSPRLDLYQMMYAVLVLAVMCWFASVLVPFWWEAVHRPTNAELAASLRRDAARWARLATEQPSHAAEYRRLADQCLRTADRIDPK